MGLLSVQCAKTLKKIVSLLSLLELRIQPSSKLDILALL